MPGHTLLRAVLGLAAAIAGFALIARAWIGPYQFGMSVRSPMNAASIFGAGLVLLILTARRSQPGPPTLQPHWLAVPLLLAFTTLAMWPTLGVGFLADDYSHISTVSQASPAMLAHWFTVPAPDNLFFRPVAMLSYRLDFLWAGFSPVHWHAAGLALHLVNALLVFALAGKLGLGAPPAWLAAALFAVHGSRPEAVTWVAARFDLLATLFTLTALLFFLAYRERPRALLVIGILAATSCGLLSKESAFVLPLLLGALAWLHRDRSANVRWAIAATTALAAFVFIYRWMILGGIGGYVDSAGRSTITTFNAPLALKAFALRLWAVLLVPINWTDAPGPALCLTLTLALGACWALAWRARWDRTVAFGLMFTLIASLPVYHLLLIGPDLEKSRVLYLGSVGFAIALAALVSHAPRSLAITAAAALLAFQTAALRHNLATYHRVAQIHLRACNDLGTEALRLQSEVVAADMPNTSDGVYMLRTGLAECVAIRHNRKAHVVTSLPTAPALAGLPVFGWDHDSARITRLR